MAIPLPNLDDRTFDELTADARAQIPSLLPAWTNHNPSDAGIAVVELLAWLTEMLLFQVDQIPPVTTERFLTLLNGPDWSLAAGTSLDEAILETRRSLQERYRAVTPEDYEHLALGVAGVARARCVPQRNLAAADATARDAPAPAHVSLVVLPERVGGETHPDLGTELGESLTTLFDARRTLTTRVHVVGPTYVDVEVGATVAFQEDAPAVAAIDQVREALAAFYDPLTGGQDGSGWPFGRAVYASEVYARLEQVPHVNFVEDVQVTGGDELDAHELVRLSALDLDHYDGFGRSLSAEGRVQR